MGRGDAADTAHWLTERQRAKRGQASEHCTHHPHRSYCCTIATAPLGGFQHSSDPPVEANKHAAAHSGPLCSREIACERQRNVRTTVIILVRCSVRFGAWCIACAARTIEGRRAAAVSNFARIAHRPSLPYTAISCCILCSLARSTYRTCCSTAAPFLSLAFATRPPRQLSPFAFGAASAMDASSAPQIVEHLSHAVSGSARTALALEICVSSLCLIRSRSLNCLAAASCLCPSARSTSLLSTRNGCR